MKIARIMLIVLAVAFCSSCSRKISPGIYQTNCNFLLMPEAYYQFRKDSSFIYFRTITKEMQFEGVWRVDNNIVMLESKYRITDTGRSEIGSKNRNTLPNYRIKRNKLIEITTHKYRKKRCYLSRLKNYPDTVLIEVIAKESYYNYILKKWENEYHNFNLNNSNFLFRSRSPKISLGVYKANCILYHLPEAYFQLKMDSSFVYVWPYIKGAQLEGVWKVTNKNILVLIPKYYVTDKSRRNIQPDEIYAWLPKFKIKGEGLFELTKNRVRHKRCFYSRVKDWGDKILTGL